MTTEELKEKGLVIPRTFDPVFKAVFQDEKMKGVLSYIISEVTEMNEEYIYNNLIFKNTELLKNNYNEKEKVTDLIVDIDGKVINIEMNNRVDKGSIIKNNLYHHKLMSEKLRVNEEYKKINKVIQINFDNVNKYDNRLIIRFMMQDYTGKYILDENYINYHINMEKVLEKRL